ncbi:MAG: ATP phosphoribosyltransferase regulatory subunit [Clostridia bacterium]|nr:ATP phosphoribosyltransferase regulatory subunit [Clostridia bacterium]
MSETILKEEERVAFQLRSLYRRYGYLPYKMSKFEEYDLYVGNKEFLVSDGVITFNDTDGKLLALKPDVTLSIVKNIGDTTEKRKVYYHENVYRISGATKQYKEIMQAGVECIGDVDGYDVLETVLLAAKSLLEISPNFALDVSHLGIVSAILEEIGKGEKFNAEITRCLAEKNPHETAAVCERYGVKAEDCKTLLLLLRSYGDMKTVLAALQGVCKTGKTLDAYRELEALGELLSGTEYADKIRFDLSLINDMNYYNGIVFKGFVDGVYEGVLSGGQYDKLLSKMGKKAKAIGFAVYLDLLEGLYAKKREFDADTLVLYDENTPLKTVLDTVEELAKTGKSVNARKEKGDFRYGEIVDLTGGKR